jgi:DNA primase|tara:strand:+ start:3656 stop:4507 length:852 start_codon:yes stop_codon:yes gene_type:complete
MNVEELLNEKGVDYRSSGKDFVIRCLNHDHDDTNPSMRVDKETGIFHCFSCGYKGQLHLFYGLHQNTLDVARTKLLNTIKQKQQGSAGQDMPSGAMPYKGNFRQIAPWVYQEFETFTAPVSPFTDRLCFPVKDITNKIVAFVCRGKRGVVPKYYNTPVGANLPLYPMSAKPINNSIVLTEGIFDVLKLYMGGLTNSMCCFGVSGVNEDKLSLLKLKGIQKVDILLDNDEAGRIGAEKIKQICDRIKLGAEIRELPADVNDAGDLSIEQVRQLRSMYYGKNSTD